MLHDAAPALRTALGSNSRWEVLSFEVSPQLERFPHSLLREMTRVSHARAGDCIRALGTQVTEGSLQSSLPAANYLREVVEFPADRRKPALTSPTRARGRVASSLCCYVEVLTCALFTSHVRARTLGSGYYKRGGHKAPRNKLTGQDRLTSESVINR